MLNNVFYKSFFYYTLYTKKEKIITRLVDIYSLRYNFHNKNFLKIISQVLKIANKCLIEAKKIKKFNNLVLKFIIQIIKLAFINRTYTEILLSFLITTFENYPIIFCNLF